MAVVRAKHHLKNYGSGASQTSNEKLCRYCVYRNILNLSFSLRNVYLSDEVVSITSSEE